MYSQAQATSKVLPRQAKSMSNIHLFTDLQKIRQRSHTTPGTNLQPDSMELQ